MEKEKTNAKRDAFAGGGGLSRGVVHSCCLHLCGFHVGFVGITEIVRHFFYVSAFIFVFQLFYYVSIFIFRTSVKGCLDFVMR